MGMFDSLYDRQGNEWQTKAYDCQLNEYSKGDELPEVWSDLDTYQVQVFGGPIQAGRDRDAFATVRKGILTSVPARRDKRLPLVNYSGHLIEEGGGNSTSEGCKCGHPETDHNGNQRGCRGRGPIGMGMGCDCSGRFQPPAAPKDADQKDTE